MSIQVILAQALLGLNVGVFYAMLSLGLAVIFGLLNIINFAHGAMYMLGAFIALIGYSFLEKWLGVSIQIGFWASLVIVPLLVGLLGVLIERFLLRRLYELD
ncbi:MAG: branched-chain amino acid ABC transporter permease, partial [Marinobacter sp.]